MNERQVANSGQSRPGGLPARERTDSQVGTGATPQADRRKVTRSTDGERILALDEAGQLILFQADPEKFDVLDQRKISEAPCWAHVAFSNGQLFVRDLESLTVYQRK